MPALGLRIAGTVALLVVIAATGVWLSHAGRPLSAVVLAVHKLSSLAAVALVIVTLVQVGRAAGLASPALGAAIVAGIAVAAAIASGGFLSLAKPMPPVVLTIHQVASASTVLATAATLYLVLGRR